MLSRQGIRRYIPESIKKEIWKRDQNACTFVSPITGKKCNSDHQLEIHHLQSFAKGGAHTIENLALMCKTHNQYLALKDFGRQKMERYIRF